MSAFKKKMEARRNVGEPRRFIRTRTSFLRFFWRLILCTENNLNVVNIKGSFGFSCRRNPPVEDKLRERGSPCHRVDTSGHSKVDRINISAVDICGDLPSFKVDIEAKGLKFACESTDNRYLGSDINTAVG